MAKTANEPVVMVTASNWHNKVKWNRWKNGIVLIDSAAPQAWSEDKTIKEWMVHFNDEMKQKFDALNTQVDELEKSR